jgi:NAD(P)-dependent dehydrogenase (short-subunit alcohol dehydrogenase family)
MKRKLKMEDKMSSSPILKGQHAIVFGGGGSIGAAVAKEFASEGAEVFLSGQNKSNVDAVAFVEALMSPSLRKRHITLC